MDTVFRGGIKVFCGNSHRELAESIASILGLKLGASSVSTFSDGEICLRILETVRDCDVFVIQSTSPPVNNNLMELLIMIDALKRASAGRITAVMPYYGYARQDRKSHPRDPISAKLVADLLTAAGASRVLTMDLHCEQIQGFFNIPVDHLIGMPKFKKYYREYFGDMSGVMVVSPDLGSSARARSLADGLQTPVAIVDKKRDAPNESKVMDIIGNVQGKKCILIDDVIDTAGSITNAAKALIEAGATEVYACCTHGVISGPAIERLAASPIKQLITLDTIAPYTHETIDKMKYLSIADVLANAISRIHEGRAVSEVYD